MSELVTSRAAGLLTAVYRMLGGRRRWNVARVVCYLLLKIERGAFRSATARRVLLEDFGVRVGAYTYGECLIPGLFPPSVEVGRYTSIGAGARVYNQNHPLSRLSMHPYFYEEAFGFARGPELPRHTLVIGHDVWIGRNAVVTPGCRRIGNGAVIGAGAVVTKDVADFSVVAGVPARHLRYRFDEATRGRIAECAWWLRPIEEIAGDSTVMTAPAAELSRDTYLRLSGRAPDAG